MKNYAIVLAANDESRMRSPISRALHKLAGREMIHYVLDGLKDVALDETLMTVRKSQAEAFRAVVGEEVRVIDVLDGEGSMTPVEQLARIVSELVDCDGYTFVLMDNQVFIDPSYLAELHQGIKKTNARVGTATWLDISRYEDAIPMEQSQEYFFKVDDENEEYIQKALTSVGLPIYCFQTAALVESLRVSPEKMPTSLNECVIDWAKKEGAISMTMPPGVDNIIEDLITLDDRERELRSHINDRHMSAGVRMLDAWTTYIDYDVTIAPGVTIYPGNFIEGKSHIGADAVLLQGNYIENSVVGDGARVGPYAHLRPHTTLGAGCRVGNFIELKNITVGDGAKIPHLSYCGDGSIGARSNIGCGVIFSNYDGVNKMRTEVGEGVFVGCNSNLVAPVTVGDGAYIAAGSTITEDVPDGALGIARSRQKVSEGWAKTKSPITRARTEKAEKEK